MGEGVKKLLTKIDLYCIMAFADKGLSEDG